MGTSDFMQVLHELAVFVRVAESGSFSEAARQLDMTPSAVSRQVARLEKAAGVQLLRRSTRQLRLTEAGVDALERGRDMVSAARGALQVAEEHMCRPQGVVRLSAPKAFARHVLQPVLLDFMARFPSVDVHLMVSDGDVDPLRDNVDIAVRLTDAPPQGLVARALMPVRQVLVASPAYLAAHEPIRVPLDLTAHSCLFLGERARDNRWCLVRDEDRVEVLVQGRYAVNHSEMRLNAVEAGLGVGCLPDFVARDALAAGRVVVVLSDWAFVGNYQGDACALFVPSRFTVPKVRMLIDHLVAALPTTAALLPERGQA